MIRNWLSLIVLMAVFAPSSWAKDEGDESLQQEICERMLGYTLKSVDNGLPIFDLRNALGMRGFLGSYPKPTVEASAAAFSQGAFDWGHSMAVRKSVREAAEHDAQFTGLSKILYFISDVDVSDLTPDTAPEVIQSRFEKIFAVADLIYFETDSQGTRKMFKVSDEAAYRLIHPKTIGWYSADERGPRFIQDGWVFPKIRGALIYKNVFLSGSSSNKKVIKAAKLRERAGHLFTFNRDFLQALNKARDQVRIVTADDGSQRAIPEGSRYREERTYQAALEGYKQGTMYSIEEWDAEGHLVAGVIAERHGNLVAFQTIFYDFVSRTDGHLLTTNELLAMADVRSQVKSLIDNAKAVALAGLLRLHDAGIDVSDAGMVTPFTASIKGVYVPGHQFAEMVRDLQSRPPVNLDLATPFTFENRPE